MATYSIHLALQREHKLSQSSLERGVSNAELHPANFKRHHYSPTLRCAVSPKQTSFKKIAHSEFNFQNELLSYANQAKNVQSLGLDP